MEYDVAVIGAGVTGCLIARALSRHQVNICLIEKEEDVAMGTSKANSAIIHAGYDAKNGTLKAKLNVEGNRMMERTAAELGVPFKRIGSLVLAFDDAQSETVRELYENGVRNGVPGLEILDGAQARKMEPALSPQVASALHAPSAGIICPYELTIGAAENAVSNGAKLLLGARVQGIDQTETGFTVHTAAGDVRARYLVNAAGLRADEISAMAGDPELHIRPRRGEYMILDKSTGGLVHSVIFQTPNEMGKGILVTPTVDGNLLVGPNAHDILNKEDLSTTAPGLEEIREGALRSVPSIPMRQVITSFAGLRAVPLSGDFIIRRSEKTPGLIQAAGIESPGLSSAPAIAEHVVSLLREAGLALREKPDYNPIRLPLRRFAQMSDEEKAAKIKEDPRYGHVICRCETVTEGEICESIRRPAGARSLDAVKRRTRAGMGRCQGGFCTPRAVAILARELGISELEVTKAGKGSELLAGRIK
jgi:glycerol-3-phosphate dehydrogenase